ncbi:MAG TPA: XdhC family protein [Stellaceae bacterium]|nr:XdhC family protein [Stellaceae bacterium]
MKLSFLEKALAASRAGAAAALATDLLSGDQCFIEGDTVTGPLRLDGEAVIEARRALRDDQNMTITNGGRKTFVEVFNPRLRCVIVGAVHIAQPLARMAALTGYLVTIIDPRSAFASVERFPEVTLTTEWPDDALKSLAPGRRTAIVTLTHDPKIDDPALAEALRSPAFYIGALGSKKTHAARLRRLTALGFTEADFARIHGPIGLDIGALSPAEIAVSIIAEITRTLRADRLRERAGA